MENNHPAEITHHGKSLAQWARDLSGNYTINDLYRIIMEGGDLAKMKLREDGLLTID